MDRRRFIAGALALAATPAQAEPAFKRLMPLLVDLPGLEGRKPDGMSMETGEGRMTTAERFYEKAPSSLHVTIVSGPAAQSPLGGLTEDMKVETAEGHMKTEAIDGFRVMKTYKDADKSGALLISLDNSTLMTVDYRDFEEDAALALARRVDWKAIAAAAK